MKIQLASDLHLELLHGPGADRTFERETIIQPAPEADLMVLAGDIHVGVRAVELFRYWPVPILYVAGNHEFYRQLWGQTRHDLSRVCGEAGIRFLDNDQIVIGGVRILGTTLWTDFQLHGYSHARVMREGADRLADFQLIQTRTGTLTPAHILTDHQASRRWLESALAKPFDGKTVVITHHAPHPLSVHRRFVGDMLNGCFVSDLTPLLFHADLWLHGHTHDSFDYRVGRCRVVANAAGYIKNSGQIQRIEEAVFENEAWNPQLVLEV